MSFKYFLRYRFIPNIFSNWSFIQTTISGSIHRDERVKVYFYVSHDYAAEKFYDIVKHEKAGTGFFGQKSPLQLFVGEITILTHKC